jgi:hypothetical protein
MARELAVALACVVWLGWVGCAPAATLKTFRPTELPSGEGAFFGRIVVRNHGEDVTESCELVVARGSDERSSFLRSYWVCNTSVAGLSSLQVVCYVGGGTLYFPALTVELRPRTVTYIGNLELSAAVTGYSTPFPTRENVRVEMQVKNRYDDALRTYARVYGKSGKLLDVQPSRFLPPQEDPHFEVVVGSDAVTAFADLNGFRLALAGTPHADPEHVDLYLYRPVGSDERLECSELELLVGENSHRAPLVHETGEEIDGPEEVLKAEIELTLLRAIATARSTKLAFCGTQRILPLRGVEAIAEFLTRFNAGPGAATGTTGQ